MRISDWSSDVCSSDLAVHGDDPRPGSGGHDRPAADPRAARPGCGETPSERAGRPAEAHPMEQTAFPPDRRRRGGQGERPGFDRAGPDHRHSGGRRMKIRSEEHTSELQSLMRISYAVFCLKKKKKKKDRTNSY